jgi:hypothetical protein
MLHSNIEQVSGLYSRRHRMDNAGNEFLVQVLDWTEVERLEREARAYRRAYLAASARRAWRWLMNQPRRLAGLRLEHRHA